MVPELAPLVAEARSGGNGRLVQGQVTLSRKGRERILLVRVTGEERSAEPDRGFVVTLDDITELVTAQRTSAWADVARRIAHEIKNPLTPIQLSAERLKRKYGKRNRNRSRGVRAMHGHHHPPGGRHRGAWSTSSRPSRACRSRRWRSATRSTPVRQVVFLMQVGYPKIDFRSSKLPDAPVIARFDRRQISQALTNIVKNATEAIAAAPDGSRDPAAHRDYALSHQGDVCRSSTSSTTASACRRRIASACSSPTSRPVRRAPAWGLTIVGKILEDHGGGIELADAPAVAEGGRGAWVRLRFAIDPPAPAAATRQPVPR